MSEHGEHAAPLEPNPLDALQAGLLSQRAQMVLDKPLDLRTHQPLVPESELSGLGLGNLQAAIRFAPGRVSWFDDAKHALEPAKWNDIKPVIPKKPDMAYFFEKADDQGQSSYSLVSERDLRVLLGAQVGQAEAEAVEAATARIVTLNQGDTLSIGRGRSDNFEHFWLPGVGQGITSGDRDDPRFSGISRMQAELEVNAAGHLVLHNQSPRGTDVYVDSHPMFTTVPN